MKLTTLLVAGVTALGLVAPASAAQQLLIGTTSASSSSYGYFVAVAKLINDKVKGVNASVVETGATLDNLRRLQRHQIDFGIATTNIAQNAYSGTKQFKGHKQDIRLLWVYMAAPQNVVVRQDAGINALKGLDGRRFNPGIRGSGTESTTEAVFDKLGIKPDYVRGSTTDVVDMIKDNRVTGYVKSGAGEKLDASTLDIMTFTPIDILSLTEAQQKTLEKEMPDISIVTIPKGAADGMPGYTTWSFGVGVVANADMDEKTAYKIVDTIMQDKTVQANAMAELKGTNLADLTMKYGTIPLHPGAARWFKEHGYHIPDRIAPKK